MIPQQAGMTCNAAFPTAPVVPAALDADRQKFEDALAKSNKGSVADTAAKDAARAVLVEDLRQDAIYVEATADGVAARITSTGYQTTTHDHSPMATMPIPTRHRCKLAMGHGHLVPGARHLD